MQEGHHISAATGARILIDRATTLKVGDIGGFDAKLKAMVGQNLISQAERDLLDSVTDAGNAAAHRGYSPKTEDLHIIMDTIENLLHRLFVLPGDSGKLKLSIPPRHLQPKV